MLLGGASKLVATTTVVQGLPWFIKLDPAITTIPAPFTSTAGQVNMEMLIATNPDVLLCSAGSFTAATMAKFAAANIPVVQMPAATFADLQTTVNITAQVIGLGPAYCRQLYQLPQRQYSNSIFSDLSNSDRPASHRAAYQPIPRPQHGRVRQPD